MATCPDPPRDESREQLGFEPRPMVRWFDPVQLAGTALQVVVSSLFGAYSDKREIQAALAPGAAPTREYADDGEIWIDYVADLGDGFEPTYTVASLLARPQLTVGSWDTRRGRILVMGGDQVYPTATRTEYDDRMKGPYGAALPCVVPEEAAPHLYAIPGNHDWYDGLTSFIRIFCQEHWIGGWKTKQARSYFAFELPHRWWLWAIDIQFDVYIDDPQLAYFRKAKELLQEGDRLILVTGKPSWTKAAKHDPSYANLAFFEDEMIGGTGAKLSVVVSGDLHHYARYEDRTGGRQRITSGGGGAYLFPTHHLPDKLPLDEADGVVNYELNAVYPPRPVSQRLRWRAVWRLPARNWRFLRVLFALYFVVGLLLQVPVRKAAARSEGLLDMWIAALTSRWLVFAVMVLLPAFVLFAAGRGLLQRLPLGAVHATVHLAVISWLVALTALALPHDWAERYGVLIALPAAVVASLPGACAIGLYLALCDRFFGERLDRHANEVFSCQSIMDWKNFLRLHIDGDGRLTIYPIGVDRVARRRELRLNTGGAPGDPFFLLPDTLQPRLIEDEPIRLG